MATTPNQKPVPSEDYANMRFNAGKLDEFVTSTESTYTDRLGQEHMTAEGIRVSADDLRSDLASSDIGDGASLVYLDNGINLQEALSLGRVVYPEMYGVNLSAPTDDELFTSMFLALEAKDDTLLGTSLLYTVDLRGKTYNLFESHSVDININIINGNLLMDGGQIIISNEIFGNRTRRVILKDLRVRYIGDTYFPDALIKIPRCYNSFAINCDIWAGVSTTLETTGTHIGKPQRARYGLWMGSRRAWGCGVVGGEYFGGEVPCRIGYTNDHTGLTITGGATFHHGTVANLLVCNPSGFSISGINVEHSDNGGLGLVITSGTNVDAGATVVNPAQCGVIFGVYAFNNGNGSTGTDLSEAGILIGYDVPNTMDWDTPGFLITSQNTAHSIRVEECYVVSPKQKYAVKMRGLSGLKVLNNKYTYSSTVSVAMLFEGTCARSDCADNRNQSSGLFDEVGYTSTSKPRVGKRSGTFLPALVGATTAGSLTYSTRGGDYTIDDDRCHLNLWLTVGSITTQPDGAITIVLPVSIVSGRRSAGALDHVNLLGSQSVAVSLPVSTVVSTTGALNSDSSATLSASGTGSGTASGNVLIPNRMLGASTLILGGTTLQLRVAGLNMLGSMIGASTALELSLTYPVDGATYLG